MTSKNNPEATRIIGIDPGTRVTGYGIIELVSNSYILKDFGCIRPPASAKLTDRYHVIFNCLEEIIASHCPSVLVVETQFVQKNIQSAIKLGMARGIAIIAAKRAGLPVFEYSPAEAKRAVVGNGKASKDQVQWMVQKLLRLAAIPEPEDAADALALCICHAHARQSAKLFGSEI